jgi:hypothetical protein
VDPPANKLPCIQVELTAPFASGKSSRQFHPRHHPAPALCVRLAAHLSSSFFRYQEINFVAAFCEFVFSAVLVDKWSTFSAESSVTALKCCASMSILVSGGTDLHFCTAIFIIACARVASSFWGATFFDVYRRVRYVVCVESGHRQANSSLGRTS